MINTSKPTTSITNGNRIQSYNTWDFNTSTWDSETRTWDEMGTNMTNSSRPTTVISNTSKP